MISLKVGGCDVDILPFVSGLESEAEKVRDAFGKYEAYGTSLGIEGIQAVERRAEIDDDPEVGELDLVYAKLMERFGQVELPSPAVCELVDLCAKEGMTVIPLDMNDEEFTELYCGTVKTLDFVREHHHAKKGLKTGFPAETPEELAVQWDAFVNRIRGYREVSSSREAYIAAQIRDISKYRKSLLALIEVERCDGIVALLET
ncbi:MAG: hypothetical protein J5674_04545 [Candidatus Methanomethylophilaceae archaeon]|nr:hypothetical protein [Candidatus Methanomethylophilaceae archaeon]